MSKKINVLYNTLALVSLVLLFIPACKKDKYLEIATEISNISSDTVTVKGIINKINGNKILSKGICYSTLPNPTASNALALFYPGETIESGTGSNSFSEKIDLKTNSTYYFRAFVRTDAGTVYGNEEMASTLPRVTITSAHSFTESAASIDVNVFSEGEGIITRRGVCYSKEQNPTIENNTANAGEGPGLFSVNISGLEAMTSYYVRAYATTVGGTAYSDELFFSTEGPPGATTIWQENFQTGSWGTGWHNPGSYIVWDWNSQNYYAYSELDSYDTLWIVTPNINLGAFTSKRIIFETACRSYSTTATLEALISSNYTTGNPGASATWTKLTGKIANKNDFSSGTVNWISSSYINLDQYQGQVKIAFRSVGDPSQATVGRFGVDNIKVIGF